MLRLVPVSMPCSMADRPRKPSRRAAGVSRTDFASSLNFTTVRTREIQSRRHDGERSGASRRLQ